ncbi:MAG: helix-turn-helix domain-containing protein, partial [Candidatus Pacebacteria bacterium]|nr:helix-turn-helix domain-containing protein [Candidatus Paceibacterota bacterium]
HMPPLRKRIDDIPLLVNHFIHRFGEDTGKHITGLDRDAMRAVMDYCWPGNVRELENAIEYAFVTCQNSRIGLLDLPQDLRRVEIRRETCREEAAEGTTANAAQDAQSILQDPQRLQTLIQESGNNKAEAARRLGVSRKTIWKWFNRHAQK